MQFIIFHGYSSFSCEFPHFVVSFDVVLDPFGGDLSRQYARLLSKWKGSIFVTLAPPVLNNTDKLGAGLGLLSAGQNLASTAIPEVKLLMIC